MSEEFEPLPKVIQGRGITIKIDAPILSDKGMLEQAVQNALQSVAEAIQADVTTARKELFADQPNHNTFKDYGGRQEYYESGMIPYWRGGLLGSFELLGNDDSYTYKLGFNVAYARIIEEGGMASGELPVEWIVEKLEQEYQFPILVITAHPFMEAVAYKIQVNLEEFGYLDTFGTTFVNSIMA